MPNKEISYKIIRSILSDKDLLKEECLPFVINKLIAKHTAGLPVKKPSIPVEKIICRILTSSGICISCQDDTVAKKTDTVCLRCKKISREQCKKDIESNFLLL